MHFKKKLKQAVRGRVLTLMGKAKDNNAQFDAVLSHFIKSKILNPVIFDVGAHRGESINRYRALFPGCEIHAFEPDEENFKILKGKEGTRNTLNNCGVSAAKGKLTFHRNLKSSTSSFHAVNTNSQWAKNRSARHDVMPEQFTARSYDVPVIDLDSYIAEKNIARVHLLKIDTQGHEDEVLKGCKNALESGLIDIIETELIVGDAYVKSLQFYNLEKILIPAGYRFYAIDHGGDRLRSPSLSFNIIYVHEKLLR